MINALSPDQLRAAFGAVTRALPFDALRMKPREKMFALLLAWESLARGQASGPISVDDWREVLSDWRLNEIDRMLLHFKRSAWLVIDAPAKTFSLTPDRWPGWQTVTELQRLQKQSGLDLTGRDDLNAAFAKISQLEAARHGCENFAAQAPCGGPPSESPQVRSVKPPDNPGLLRSLRNGFAADGDGELNESLRGLAADLVAFKKKHKGIKPLMDFESLREALLVVETAREEAEAYVAMCGILGGIVMEGGDLDRHGKIRNGDGGKWRSRWRTNRAKTFRVLASLVEEIKVGRVESRGGQAEQLWKEFSQSPAK